MRVMLFCLALATAAPGQTPVPAEQEPYHRLILRNEHVVVTAVEVPPHQATQLHRHDRPYLAVTLTEATLTTTVPGKPPAQQKRRAGEAWMAAPVTHAVHNDGDTAFRATVVDFLAPQRAVKPVPQKSSRYCNPKSTTACVSERYLFCTDRVCVSEVEMGPGAVTMKHSHSTDHMVIAISDLEMKDMIEGRAAPVMRSQKSGEVLFADAGITHQLENGPKPARFITVSWK